MDGDVLGVAAARRARWPAVYAGRVDRVLEFAIGGLVAGNDASPARIGEDRVRVLTCDVHSLYPLRIVSRGRR